MIDGASTAASYGAVSFQTEPSCFSVYGDSLPRVTSALASPSGLPFHNCVGSKPSEPAARVSATSFLMAKTLGEPSSRAKNSGLPSRALPMTSCRGAIVFGPAKRIVTFAVGWSSPNEPAAA